MHPEYIPYDKALFQGLSFTDFGRLFTWEGQLFRGIPSSTASFCRSLFTKGIIRDLVEKKLLVETEITPMKLDHYEIVLKHRMIPFVSYPQEWCDLMLKEAALHHMALCIELDSYDLECGDAHPLNILFEGAQPIFVDFGSINTIPVNSSGMLWSRYDQFCRTFLYPLRLMAHGHGRIARWLLHDYERGVLKSDLEALVSKPFLAKALGKLWYRPSCATVTHASRIVRSIINGGSRSKSCIGPGAARSLRSRSTYFMRIKQEIESIRLPPRHITAPHGKEKSYSPISPLENPPNRSQIITNVLSDLRPGSVLIVFRNTEAVKYAESAVRNGSQVVAANANENHIRALFLLAKQGRLPILPLQIDFFSPSCDLSNYWFPPASERLKCDMVLALDLVDHLIFEENIHPDVIAQRLSILSNRWLIVNFRSFKDRNGLRSETDAHHEHSGLAQDGFIEKLMKWFRSAKILSSRLDPRVSLLCEK